MGQTEFLRIGELEENQRNPEIPTNTAINALDRAVAGILLVHVTGGTTILNDEDYRYNRYNVMGLLTANQIIEIPPRSKDFTVCNLTTGAFTLSFKTEAGAPIEVAQDGGIYRISCDGEECQMLSGGGGGTEQIGGIVVDAPLTPVDGKVLGVDGGVFVLVDPPAADVNATEIQGIPVSNTAPTNNQILKFNSTSGELEFKADATGGGGGTGNLPEDYPIAIPASPTADDMEFSEALSGGTWHSQDIAIATQELSHLVIRALPSDDNKMHAMFWPLPHPTVWKARAKINFDAVASNFQTVVIGVINGTKVEGIGLSHNNGFSVIGNQYDAGVYVGAFGPIRSIGGVRDIFVEIESDGTDLFYRFSFNGVGWMLHDQHAVTSYFAGAPTAIGLGIWRNSGTTETIGSCDFIRFIV